jgi:hypothetical protein
VAPAVVLIAAIAFSWPHWSAPVRWAPDALFYEAQAHELMGQPAREARQPASISLTSPHSKEGDKHEKQGDREGVPVRPV